MIKFDISSLKPQFQINQFQAMLSLKVKSVYETTDALYVENSNDEYDNCSIDNFLSSGIIDSVAFDNPIQADDIITFDVTSALEDDLFNSPTTDFSGFVLTGHGYYRIVFFSSSDTVNGPKLTIYSNETLITLSTFSAVPKSNKTLLQWSTASEINNAGFNIYRSVDGGEYEQINDTLIPAEGSPTEGASYEFVDDDVQNRTTYSYILEDVDLNGTTKQHGPAKTTPRLIYGIGR